MAADHFHILARNGPNLTGDARQLSPRDVAAGLDATFDPAAMKTTDTDAKEAEMPRKIRVTSETYDFSHDTDCDYVDLPDDWDDRTEDDREAYLDTLAMEALYARAGSGAEVVTLDERGNEVRD